MLELISSRFFVHPTIDALAADIVSQHGSSETEKAMLFPSSTSANRCIAFFKEQNPKADLSTVRLLRFVPDPSTTSSGSQYVQPRVSAVVYPKDLWPTAKAFWQHTGEGISSRQGEFCHRAYLDGSMIEATSKQDSPPRLSKGPRRYQKPTSVDHGVTNGSGPHVNGGHPETNGISAPDSALFVEERFGRNLNAGFARQAKLAVRKRIAGSLTNDSDLPTSLEEPFEGGNDRSKDVPNFSADDVYLYPRGMNAIFNAHLALRSAVREEKSIMYGFPYVDTLKVLEKFGPGAAFYGHGNASDLDDLESRLQAGERFLALFCEFPGNPLLKTPDLKRIRELSNKYDFAVVIDETIGNFLNVHLLPHADVLVSSLTKIFSGDSNVMGGAMILNPKLAVLRQAEAVSGKELRGQRVRGGQCRARAQQSRLRQSYPAGQSQCRSHRGYFTSAPTCQASQLPEAFRQQTPLRRLQAARWRVWRPPQRHVPRRRGCESLLRPPRNAKGSQSRNELHPELAVRASGALW